MNAMRDRTFAWPSAGRFRFVMLIQKIEHWPTNLTEIPQRSQPLFHLGSFFGGEVLLGM